MNITSMSGAELFRTIMGKEPSKSAIEVIKESANWKKEAEAEKAEIAKGGNNKIGVRDTFTRSEEIEPKTDSFDNFMEYDRALIGPEYTKEQIATYYGDMAKRLDEAYAAGKFTEEEYKELNDGIMEHFDKVITQCERSVARREVTIAERNRRNLEYREMLMNRFRQYKFRKFLESLEPYDEDADELTGEETSQFMKLVEVMKKAEKDKEEDGESDKMYSEEEDDEDMNPRYKNFDPEVRRWLTWVDKQVNVFVSKYCRNDRAALRNMVETVRHGGELPGGRSRVSSTRNWATWFTDGYVPKVYF
ncbi:MAG: hypothetical protein K2K57_11870 [Oscillospiraceae bacterium]|nr:hypothetical protein [Oscillospiraceae bacterium]